MDFLKVFKPLVDIFLLPLFEDIDRVRLQFNFLSFQHIYKESNVEDDALSKKGLLMVAGTLDKWELTDSSMFSLGHCCF